MSPTVLSKILGADLQACREENPARCALADQAGQYLLDEDQQIIALNLFGYDGEDGRPALPPPADWLPDLLHLKYLNLARCGLKKLDLTAQTDLVVLFAQENKALAQLQLPAAFPALLRADLSHCALARVVWPDSPVLEFLNVSRQADKSLTDWSFATACPRLYFCDLSHNGLTRFQLEAGFTNLAILCLEENALVEVEFGGPLLGLESLRLGGNKLTEVPLEWHDLIGDGINLYVEGNDLSEDFQTALEGSPFENSIVVKEILSARIASGIGEDDECKVLIVGNGRVGKTTMYRKLNGLEPKKDENSTHGVTIANHPWPVKRPIFNVQFWDFGGQDIYHATHRLFLQSSAVYIIAWDPESERRPQTEMPEEGPYGIYQNFKLPYWLDYVYRSSGGGQRSYRSWEENKSEVPVLVVQTKKQDGEEDPAIVGGLNRYFEDAQADLSVESIPDKDKPLDNDGYELLEYHLKRALRKAKKGDTAANSWIELRQKLRERKEEGVKYLELTEYEALARKVEDARGSLGRHPVDIAKNWLHNTGVVFYQETATGPRIILDQHWATKAIYAILQRQPDNHCEEIQKNNGFFTGKDLQRYWAPHLTGSGDEELFEEFMLKCEVAYRVNKKEESAELPDRQYCAPQLLPKEPQRTRDRDRLLKNIENNPGDWWHLRLYNEFLHAGIVRRLIIKLHDSEERDWVWRRGMILADEEDKRALIQIEKGDRAVNISISKSSKPLLNSIAAELRELPKTDAPDFMWVSKNGQQWVDLELLRGNDKAAEVEDRDGNTVDKIGFQPVINAFSDHRGVGFDRIGELQVYANENQEKDEAVISETPPPAQLEGSGFTISVARQMRLNIFTALNQDHQEIGIGEEVREIKRAINRMGAYIDGQPMGNGNALASRDYLDYTMSTFSAELIHFVGHGDTQKQICRLDNGNGLNNEESEHCGIVLVSPGGEPDFVSENYLFQICRRWIQGDKKDPNHRQPKVILLNACHTASIAERVSSLGLAVIGVNGKLDDRSGIRFAHRFYYRLDHDGLDALKTAFGRALNEARDIHPTNNKYQLFINGKIQSIN